MGCSQSSKLCFLFLQNRYDHSSFSVLNCILHRNTWCMAILSVEVSHSMCPPFLVAPSDFKMSIGLSSQILGQNGAPGEAASLERPLISMLCQQFSRWCTWSLFLTLEYLEVQRALPSWLILNVNVRSSKNHLANNPLVLFLSEF